MLLVLEINYVAPTTDDNYLLLIIKKVLPNKEHLEYHTDPFVKVYGFVSGVRHRPLHLAGELPWLRAQLCGAVLPEDRQQCLPAHQEGQDTSKLP